MRQPGATVKRSALSILVLAVLVGLAAPAGAAVASRPWKPPIQLACESAPGTARRPAVHCRWEAYEGAVAYRVLRASRHDGQAVHARTVSAETTSFVVTVRPGAYVFAVQALDGHRRVLATSNRAQVRVEAPGVDATRRARPVRALRIA